MMVSTADPMFGASFGGGERKQRRVRLGAAAIVAGAFVALLLASALSSPHTRTVSEVKAEVAEILLRKRERPERTDGGPIGHLWVSAAEGDAQAGEFRDFKLLSGPLRLAARRARVKVDPVGAMLSFELSGVVLMSVPDDPNDHEERGVVHLDHFTLGPIPLRGRIVPDQPGPDFARAVDEPRP